MKRDIACKHINLHRLLSLRGEDFRWADLVSGNLKEEKNAHSTQLLHSGGPLYRRATCCIDRSESRSGTAESGVPSCTFGGKQAQTQPLRRNDSHNGCGSRPLLERASFLRCSPARKTSYDPDSFGSRGANLTNNRVWSSTCRYALRLTLRILSAICPKGDATSSSRSKPKRSRPNASPLASSASSTPSVAIASRSPACTGRHRLL